MMYWNNSKVQVVSIAKVAEIELAEKVNVKGLCVLMFNTCMCMQLKDMYHSCMLAGSSVLVMI